MRYFCTVLMPSLPLHLETGEVRVRLPKGEGMDGLMVYKKMDVVFGRKEWVKGGLSR